MRKLDLGRRRLSVAVTGIMAVPGGVLAYRPRFGEPVFHSMPPFAVQRLTHAGRHSVPQPDNGRADVTRTWVAIVGGPVMVGRAEWVAGDIPVTHGTVATWGMRYPNVTAFGRLTDGRVVFLWAARDRSSRFYPWRAAPVIVNETARGGLLWRYDAVAVRQWYDLSPIEVAATTYDVASMRGQYPGSLAAAVPDGTAFYRLRHDGRTTYWDFTRPPGQRCAGETVLAPPPGLRHPFPSDLQVAPDGRRLFVAWSGKGVDNVRRACAIGVYAAGSGEVETFYTFPAALLAPSPDGLTLSFLDSFGGWEETALHQIDLD